MNGRHALFIVVFLCLTVQCILILPGSLGCSSGLSYLEDDSEPQAKQTLSSSWLFGWSFRKSHTIEGSTGAGPDYQIRIVAHYGSGNDSGADVYLDHKSQADFDDIRFTDEDGLTLLQYWMEEAAVSDQAVFWVRIGDNLNFTVHIYVYYGNYVCSSISNGFATLIFFEDFESGVLSPARWEDPGDWQIVETNVKHGSYAAYCVAMAPELTLWCNLTSKHLNYGFMLHVWARFGGLSGSAGYPELFRDSDGEQVYSVMVYFGQYCYDHVGSNPTPWPANNTISSNTYYRTELGFDFQNDRQRCWKSGSYMGEIDLKDIFGGSVTEIIYYGPASGYHSGEDVWLDDCYIRKWVPDEPVHAAWGIEEIGSAPADMLRWHHDCSNTTGWVVDVKASESNQFDLGIFEVQDNVSIVSDGVGIYSNSIPYHSGYFHGATFTYTLTAAILAGYGLAFRAQVNHTGSSNRMGGVTVALYDENKSLAYFVGTQDMWYGSHVVTILGYKDEDGRRLNITDRDGPLVVGLRIWQDETDGCIYANDTLSIHSLATKGTYVPERWIRYVALTFYNGEDNQYESERVVDISLTGQAGVLAISHPEDIEYEAGTTGHSIDWTHSVPLPGAYEILRNGESVRFEAWDGSRISVPVDGFDPGVYNFTNVIRYNMTEIVSDTVIVTVVDTTPPVINHPVDIRMNETDTGLSIVWTPSDLYPASWEVRLNGTVVASGAWNSTGEDVVVSLNGLNPGTYVYTITVADMSGNLEDDMVAVRVERVPDWWELFGPFGSVTMTITIGSLAVMVIFGALICRTRK
ncbi:MAG: hypothetical protein C4K49_09815 [Candidatus Thorarchaeota archaeon]|nr:MAG: hypothetical protein C4K49_09815 [Candidatus Thorarchaeota archaeon]